MNSTTTLPQATRAAGLVWVLLAAIVMLGAFAEARAQGSLSIAKVRAVPAGCNSISNPVIFKIPSSASDTTSGFYICNPSTRTYQFQTNTFGAGLTAKTMLYANATRAIVSTAAPTNGQLLIGDTGNIPALGTLSNTTNETLITNGAHSISIGLAATIQHKAGANFVLTDTADITKTFTFGLSNISTGTNRSVNIPDAASTTVQALTAVDGLVVNAVSGTTGIQSTTTVDALLSTTAAVNMNTATATTLYTCPTGRSCVITKVVMRNASTSLTTASYSFGWTGAAFADVIANATHTELTGATLYTLLFAKAGSTLGTSTGTFKVLMNTLQGGAATTTIDVFGYTF